MIVKQNQERIMKKEEKIMIKHANISVNMKDEDAKAMLRATVALQTKELEHKLAQ